MSLIPLDERLHPFQTVYNFRDFGGYAGLDGRPLVTGQLFRSAHLNALSDAEIERLDSLPIGTIVDLRHAPERERQPSKWSGGAEVLVQPAAEETLKVAPHEAFTREHLYTPDDARGYMMRSYGSRMHDPSFVALHRDALLALTEEDQARPGVLVHCAAGKDRTGTLVALIQALLGVSRDDIMADYMLTLEAVDIDAILAPAAAMFTQRYGRPMDAEMIRPMFGVEPGYLDASLDAMGDAEGYARKTLGLPTERLMRLRARYLAD